MRAMLRLVTIHYAGHARWCSANARESRWEGGLRAIFRSPMRLTCDCSWDIVRDDCYALIAAPSGSPDPGPALPTPKEGE